MLPLLLLLLNVAAAVIPLLQHYAAANKTPDPSTVVEGTVNPLGGK